MIDSICAALPAWRRRQLSSSNTKLIFMRNGIRDVATIFFRFFRSDLIVSGYCSPTTMGFFNSFPHHHHKDFSILSDFIDLLTISGMLTRSIRFSKLLASKRPLWTGWTRSSSSSLDEAAIERSPAAPGGGRTFLVPEKHFEEDDPLPVSFEVTNFKSRTLFSLI